MQLFEGIESEAMLLEVQNMIREGLDDLESAAELAQAQYDDRHYFLLEHPLTAHSWGEAPLRRLARLPGVQSLVLDQCRYGLTACGPQGTGPAQKPTRFMTNSPCIARKLSLRCPNRVTHDKRHHVHVPLVNGRARAAQTHPHTSFSGSGT